jgi:hypothetical protein
VTLVLLLVLLLVIFSTMINDLHHEGCAWLRGWLLVEVGRWSVLVDGRWSAYFVVFDGEKMGRRK